MTNVVYGSDPKFNVIDLWKAKSDKPTPLVIFIHGGGGVEGRDKNSILTQFPLDQLLQVGISCAAIDYRKEVNGKIYFPKPFFDSARAVQFLRYKAKEFNLDPARIACCAYGAGGSGLSLLIAFHKDLADPKSDDPVLRASTRLTCVTAQKAVVSFDPRWMKKNLPGKTWRGPNLAAIFGMKDAAEADLLNPPPEKAKLMEQNAPINYLTADAPPVFLTYPGENLSRRPSADIGMIDFGARSAAQILSGVGQENRRGVRREIIDGGVLLHQLGLLRRRVQQVGLGGVLHAENRRQIGAA